MPRELKLVFISGAKKCSMEGGKPFVERYWINSYVRHS